MVVNFSTGIMDTHNYFILVYVLPGITTDFLVPSAVSSSEEEGDPPDDGCGGGGGGGGGGGLLMAVKDVAMMM